MNKKPKIIIAEDQKLMREGYLSIFNEFPYFNIVGEAENGKVLLDILQNTYTDIIILDIDMPVMDGITVLPKIKKNYPDIKILMVSFHAENEFVALCIRLGANGYVTKNGDAEELVTALKKIDKEGYYFPSGVTEILKANFENENNYNNKFTNRNLNGTEIKIIQLVCGENKQNKEIAQILKITLDSVENHRKNIYKKTNTDCIQSLVKFAIRCGLISLNYSSS